MNPDDKTKVQKVVSEVFIRYGTGSHYIQKLTQGKVWNVLSWVLIVLGAFGWVVFLMWKP